MDRSLSGRIYRFFWPFFKRVGLGKQWDWVQPTNFRWRAKQKRLKLVVDKHM